VWNRVVLPSLSLSLSLSFLFARARLGRRRVLQLLYLCLCLFALEYVSFSRFFSFPLKKTVLSLRASSALWLEK
jgi:hypothetical protein